MFSLLAAVAVLALDPLFNAQTLAGAHSGAIVIDAQTGSVLYSRNANDAFIPASTMKLIVGSAALDILGDAFNFTTTVSTDRVSLYLIGGGDTLLDQIDLDDASKAVAQSGLTFPGGLRVDSFRYNAPTYPDGWQVDDLPYDYAAPVSALSFAHNALHLRVEPGPYSGAPTVMTVTPHISDSHISDDATTGLSLNPDTTALALSWQSPYAIDVRGSIPLGAKQPSEFDVAMLNPAATTLDLFVQALFASGVRFDLPPTFAHAGLSVQILWQHHSIALPGLLGAMWKPSDNLLAETLLEEIGVASGSTSETRDGGIGRETGWLKGIGIDPKTVTIADGSGMSSYDRVTPHALVTILSHDWFSSHRQTMLDDLPVAGQSGTLEHAFTNAPLAGNVFAKTGTSNHTRTLAGYVRMPNGSWRIFALMVNDWMDSGPRSADRLHAFQAAFLRAIASGKAPAALQ